MSPAKTVNSTDQLKAKGYRPGWRHNRRRGRRLRAFFQAGSGTNSAAGFRDSFPQLNKTLGAIAIGGAPQHHANLRSSFPVKNAQ
jgi:hypothetical protein